MKEVEKTFRGYKYVVTFTEDGGWRCGYVGIPEGHKLYKKYYDDITNIVCHNGNLTYSDFSPELGPDLWWIGFHCDEWKDGIDFQSLKKYNPNYDVVNYITRLVNDNLFNKIQGHVWTTIDVESECHDIIDQIIEFYNKEG